MAKTAYTTDDYYRVANGLIDLARRAREEGGVTADIVSEQQQRLNEICTEVFPENQGHYTGDRIANDQTAELV